MNLNKALILGRVTADPQLRTTPGGQSVSTFGVATNRVWRDKAGAQQQDVEFHNVVVWGRQAEIAVQYLKKGTLVLVEGRLQTRTWTDKQNLQHKTTEIICDRMQLGPRPGSDARGVGAGGADSGNVRGGGIGRGSAPAEADAPQKAPDEIPTIDIEADMKAEDLPF